MTIPSQTASPNTSQAVTLFGKMLTFSRLKFESNDLSVIENHLSNLLSHKNSRIPVVIDSDIEQNLSELVELLWAWGLQPIGVVTGILDEQATAQRLAIFPADGKRIERVKPNKKPVHTPVENMEQTVTANVVVNTESDLATTEQPQAEPTQIDEETITLTDADLQQTSTTTTVVEQDPTATQAMPESEEYLEEHITSLIYDQMLRSGQSLNHVGGDLIVTNSVNDGAEAITDNTLHIYGRGLGRLVAGATGDKDARIFCQRFNPSLVSVAGTYCLRDSIPKEVIDKPVQVSYQEGKGLVFTVMG